MRTVVQRPRVCDRQPQPEGVEAAHLPSGRRGLVVLGVWCLLANTAEACSVPVFRYALERWRPDPYEVLVYYRSPLSPEQEQLLDRLNPEYRPGEPFPNSAVSRIDLDGEVRPDFAAIWEEERSDLLPWLVLRTPWRGENETIWRGPLSAASVTTILQSSLRAEIIRRLIARDSIVWVFLNGGDVEHDDALADLCAARLADLPHEIELPPIRPEDLRELTVQLEQPPLKFSLLRVDRSSEEEAVLVQSLLAVQPDLKHPDLASVPLLFPVFGRGRVFYPLVGDQIDAVHLEELTRFLCGACQCTVKQQNPGIDLLMSVDWDAYVLGTFVDRPLPPLAGLGDFAPPVSRVEPASSGTPLLSPSAASPGIPAPLTAGKDVPVPGIPVAAAPAARSVGSLLLWTVAGLTALVVIVSLLSTLRRREDFPRRSNPPRTTENR